MYVLRLPSLGADQGSRVPVDTDGNPPRRDGCAEMGLGETMQRRDTEIQARALTEELWVQELCQQQGSASPPQLWLLCMGVSGCARGAAVCL